MTPIDLIVLNQRVGAEEADRQALPILIYFDAAWRGQGGIAAENALLRLVIIGQVIGSKSNNRAFYDVACAGGLALLKAAQRGNELLAFTTGEYQAMRKLVRSYLRVLPDLTIKMLLFAFKRADETISNMENEDAPAA